MAVRGRQVATIGDNCIDLYVSPIGQAAIGGQALNVAVHWRRLGLVSEYLGAVGDDEDGAKVIQALGEADVVADRVRVVTGATGLTHIAISSGGEREIVRDEMGVSAEYAPTPEDLSHLAGYEYVHCANLADPRFVARQLAGLGIPVSYDFSVGLETEDLDAFDTVFFAVEGELDERTAVEVATQAVAGGANLAVVTRGAEGSLLFDGNKLLRADAVPIRPVDTCGAGDTFAATLIARRLKGAGIETWLRDASIAASATCLHLGAWPQHLEPRMEVSA